MDQESKIWYVLIDGQKSGPFSADELLREEPPIPEKFTKDSLVWKTGMISWLRAADIPEFSSHFDPVFKEPAQDHESAPHESASASGGSGAKSLKIPKLDGIIEELKNNFENLRQNNPLMVTCAVVAAAVIFICFTSAFIYNFAENRREDKKLAAEIAEKERIFLETLEQKEQALRDSVERMELDRLREIRFELQRKAILDSIAKLQARKRQISSFSFPTFTDQHSGSTYKIGQFGTATWFLQDLQNGKKFSWQQASAACPQGWRLPGDNEWRSLASVLKGEAGSYFNSKHYWWSAVDDGADSWYVSGGALVCYSGSDNRSAVYRVRCVKE